MSDPTASSAFYTRWAALYDRLATDAPFVSGIREAFADALGPSRGDVVVAMGCGTGANLPYFRDRVGPEGVVVGVDFSSGVLDRARDRVARADWENVHLVRADATRPPLVGKQIVGNPNVGDPDDVTPLGTGEVDCIAASFVSGMFADPARVVDDWADVVGGGGRLALLDMARSTHPGGRLLNPAFALFARAGAPPGARTSRSVISRLDRRVRDAHRHLHERCRGARTERHLAGFARISAGTVEATADGSF